MLVSSPIADELRSPTHSASSMLLPLSLSLPSFNHHYFPSGLWAVGKSSTCFLCSLSYLILNWLNRPIYSDCWLIFLKHTSDYVLGYLESVKDSTSHTKSGYGRRKLQAWRIRWGITGESRGHWKFAALWPLENSLSVRAGTEVGRPPRPSTHFHRMKRKNDLEKFCSVHLLSKETKP